MGVLKIFKKLHLKSLRFASTERIWKAIFIEETRRNVLRLCANFVFLQWKWPSKCVLLRQNSILIFFRKPLNYTKWCSFHIEIKVFLAHYGLDFGPKNTNRLFTSTKCIWRGTFIEETRSLCEVAKHFFVFLQWKWPSKCVLLRQNANFSCVNY